MRYLWIGFFVFFGMSCGLYGVADVSDVPKNDSAYEAIVQSVDQGYMNLFSDQSFQGQRPLTRREMAIVIDKLLSELEGVGLTLSKAELQELSHLAKTFKSQLATYDNTQQSTAQAQKQFNDEQKVLHYQLTELEDKIQALSQSNDQLNKKVTQLTEKVQRQEKTNRFLWGGIVGALLLGL